jgi:hypothetical protein
MLSIFIVLKRQTPLMPQILQVGKLDRGNDVIDKVTRIIHSNVEESDIHHDIGIYCTYTTLLLCNSPTTSINTHKTPINERSIYSLAFVWALPKIGSRRVAFMISPLIFSFPAMNKDCAFAVPLTNLPKSSSLRRRVTTTQSMVSLIR